MDKSILISLVLSPHLLCRTRCSVWVERQSFFPTSGRTPADPSSSSSTPCGRRCVDKSSRVSRLVASVSTRAEKNDKKREAVGIHVPGLGLRLGSSLGYSFAETAPSEQKAGVRRLRTLSVDSSMRRRSEWSSCEAAARALLWSLPVLFALSLSRQTLFAAYHPQRSCCKQRLRGHARVGVLRPVD